MTKNRNEEHSNDIDMCNSSDEEESDSDREPHEGLPERNDNVGVDYSLDGEESDY